MKKVILYKKDGTHDVVKQVTSIQKKKGTNHRQILILQIDKQPPKRVVIGQHEMYIKYQING